MKKKSWIIKVVILIIVLVFLLNPSINPLFKGGTKEAVKAQLQETFGAVAGGAAKSILSVPKLTALLVLIAAVWLILLIINFIISKVNCRKKNASTVITLLASLVKYIGVLVVIIWGLSILGVNITAIFASVGVISLIIGFGAQSLIEDTLTGIFIIFENNFGVGDYIVLDDFRGRVKKVSIRTTTIEDDGGNLKVVNNSDIRNFQNRSENLSLAVCDIGISYDADIPAVEKVLIPALQGVYEQNADVFESVPVYKGVESLDDSAVTLRFTVQTKEENFFAARRRLTRALKLLFDENNIEIPFTQVVFRQP